MHDDLLISGRRIDAQGQSAGQVNLFIVEVRRGVAGAGQGTGAVGVESQGKAGREAVLKTAVEAATKAGENLRRTRSSFRERAHSTYDERDGHRGAEPLAANVAEDDERGSGGRAIQRNDLEEVAAHFERGQIGAGEREPWQSG